ncbi:MAG: LysR family transcriptional regulator [Oscillospiraceae bacterium]|nr:LysR family transcriptional regulator [Oscillospiraceae bacterium]
MTLQQINYAIAISETGSMNKAAEKLYITQPSLTNAIRELEKEIGIIIFNRSGKGVSLTADGTEFITYARQLYQQYETLQEKYSEGKIKRKFGVSAQHYSFAVNAFVETVNSYNTHEYEFAIRETNTADVINDVATLKSEIGILYLSDFNRQFITKIIQTNGLEFIHLIDCDVFAYLWKGHPLADRETVSIEELEHYPCLTFEQGDKSSFYFAEEIISTSDFSRVVKASDRSTMLNLMKGINGYTFCSGIICGNLNGSDFTAVRLSDDTDRMEIGYIRRKNIIMSDIGKEYIRNLQSYLKETAVIP